MLIQYKLCLVNPVSPESDLISNAVSDSASIKNNFKLILDPQNGFLTDGDFSGPEFFFSSVREVCSVLTFRVVLVSLTTYVSEGDGKPGKGTCSRLCGLDSVHKDRVLILIICKNSGKN